MPDNPSSLLGQSDSEPERRVRKPKLQGTPAQNRDAEDFVSGYRDPEPNALNGRSDSVRLVGGPCDGWEVRWLDSGSLAYFMAPDDAHPHGYYLADDGRTAVWQVDALRDYIDGQMGGSA